MEVTECTKIVLDKIKKYEPDNATKIIGYLLLNHSHEEIMDYALATEEQILSLINEAKAYLSSSPKPIVSGPNHAPIQTDPSLQYLPTHAISRPFSSPSSFRVPAPYVGSPNSLDLSRIIQNQVELASLDEQFQAMSPFGLDFPNSYGYPDGSLRGSLRSPTSPGLSEFSSKPCYYYYQGNCRHGNSCKFYHGQGARDNFAQMYGLNPNEFFCDDRVYSLASLEQLEVKICELLRARDGMPVSIAALPSMYLAMYGKTLQADGYLTESQRHGKAGFSLTKLLARLNGIRLIDRPHGQHSVVLAEDAPKYEYMNDRNEAGAALSSSHQIYLTFPAESSFDDEDVLNYFQQYGPVRDVRIPRQEKRMFGFVSFHYPETVKTILAKGAPHHICGSRVLVKPYKEKTRICERRYTDRVEFPMYYPPACFDMDAESFTMPRMYENSSSFKKQLLDEQELALEFQRRRLLGLQLSPKPRPPHSYFNFDLEELRTPQDHFSPLTLVDSGGSSSDDKLQQTENIYGEQDSGPLDLQLPDSPFASPRFATNNIASPRFGTTNMAAPGFGNNIYTVV